MTQALIGVDIGTTNLKAVAFSLDGRQLAKASVPTPTHYPQADWAEFPVDALWDGLVAVMQRVATELGTTHEPLAIAFTGMAEAGVPLCKKGQALYPAIAWFDRRVLPQMEAWENKIGAERTAKITGLPIGPAAGILRPLWLRDNTPDIYARMKTWLNLPDYAAYRLCGTQVTEFSLASRMMVLDLETKDWSKDILEAVDFDKDKLGTLAQSGTQIGTLSLEMAERLGLPNGLPVCTGGHDHLCAAVGLGVTRDGDIFDSIGTAEAMVAAVPESSPNPKNAAAGIAQGLHVLPNRSYAITGNAFGGGSFDWTRKLLLSSITDEKMAFETLIELASETDIGSGGVFFLPHLRQANPPNLDARSRGAFLGLSSDSTSGHMARAVLEGLAYEFQQILDAVHDNFGLNSTGLVASGGGTRNKLFMQIKADVSGLPITIPDVEEATCLGAAMAAGIGVGVFKSYEHAYSQFTLSQTVFEPDTNNHVIYQDRYQHIYADIYRALKSLNHKISDRVSVKKEAD